MARPVRRKKDIDRAAIERFAAHGLAGTTIRDVASAAGVAEGALYRHYAGKNEMAWALYRREAAAFAHELAEVLEAVAGEELAEQVGEIVAFVYGRYERDPDRLAFLLLSQHDFPQERLDDDEGNPFFLVRRFVRRQMRRGTIAKAPAVLTASLLMGAVLEPLVSHRYGRTRSRPRRMAPVVAAACVRILTGERP